jgi:short-subunit dehydrogenase
MNVVVTGASSGIGRALAAIFARKGHFVLAVARREERLQALSREMAETPGGIPRAAPVAYLALDITSQGAPQAVLEEAVRVFGKVHVLINNAGMSPYQEFRELSYAHLRQTIDLNVRALTELCHLFLPHMLAHGEPSHLVNVVSVGGYAPLPKFAVYDGSKHYARILTNMLQHEYRKTNIRVSGLYPGGTLTEFPSLAGQKPKRIAAAGMHTPEQVAAIAYPAILKGKRVIIPGFMNQMAALAGKVLPFPLGIRLMEFIYDLSVEQVETTYPE